MAVFLIDGDNAPGTRTKGLNYLTSEDIVGICFAKTNKYYQNHEIVKQLRESTEADVRFYFTESSKLAVDFLIAIKAEAYIQQGNKELYLISGDNHIATIATILQHQHGNIKIAKVDNIYKGYLSDLNRITSLQMVEDVIQELFNGEKEKGTQFYARLEKLFMDELTKSKGEGILQRIMGKYMKKIKLSNLTLVKNGGVAR